MLTRIGRPAAAAADAVDLLVECHGRIRTFLDLARRVAQGGDPAAVADAAGRVRRYFAEALPLHARDEEESILPRLRGRDAAVDAALDAMQAEHAAHEDPTARLVAACGALAAAPARHAELAPAVARATAELERHFEAHLAREEAVVFPAMRRLLTPADDAAIAAEMRARRGG